MQIHTAIVSDRIRLGIALMRSGYSMTSAAVKAAVTVAELDFWHTVDCQGNMPRESDRKRMKMN